MISSMTGFGRGRAEGEGVTVVVEIKSVNSRFCEISVRGPRNLAEKEVDVQNRIKESLARGRITAHLTIEARAELESAVGINRPVAQAYRNLLQDLIRELEIQDSVRLEHLLRFPEIVDKTDTAETDIEELWPVVAAALEEAITKICAMRRKEGEALLSDLAGSLDTLAEGLATINDRAPERIVAARTRLQERIAELVSEERVDRERLEFEIAIMADKLDVNEEAVRLASHIQLFRDALEMKESVGRKLNFISQEMNREINTIGSKANDPEIAHVVVRMKEELERVREQIENVQ